MPSLQTITKTMTREKAAVCHIHGLHYNLHVDESFLFFKFKGYKYIMHFRNVYITYEINAKRILSANMISMMNCQNKSVYLQSHALV